MGRFLVTQAQWKAVMGKNPSKFKGAENPVENVSLDDCLAFVSKLNKQPIAKASGLDFRLPEEDEWEYACRAGARGDYCKLADGTEITAETLDEVAWFAENSDDTTHPVGRKKPNAFGLYDMLGNVKEWTGTLEEDEQRITTFDEYNAYSETVVTEYYFYRGGNWASWQDKDESSYRDCGLGFRLCADRRAD